MKKYFKPFTLIICSIPFVLVSCINLLETGSNKTDSRGLAWINNSSRETGRAFLVDIQKEDPGYGLYSYLLFGSPPDTDIVYKRYLQAITSYMKLIIDVKELRKYISTQELNITYLPITLPPPSNPSPEWILEHYNYARARALLRNFREPLRDGPYLISTLIPLSDFRTLQKFLCQDMSSVAPEIISPWVKEFIIKSAEERCWSEEKAMELVLMLRNSIAIGAEATSEIRKIGINEMIAWVEN